MSIYIHLHDKQDIKSSSICQFNDQNIGIPKSTMVKQKLTDQGRFGWFQFVKLIIDYFLSNPSYIHILLFIVIIINKFFWLITS